MLQTIELPRVNTGKFSFGATGTQLYAALSPDYPTPHPKQAEFLASGAKRKVVVAGRRGGKTTGMALIATEGLLNNKRILYAGPTAEQTDNFWYAVRWYYRNDIDSGRLVKSETKRVIEPPNVDSNGPRIRAKTAHDADTLRGDWGDLILLDEYSLMKPDVDTVVLPMLLDTHGDIVYGGTPKRRNHFFHKYMKAVGDLEGRWDYWHFASHDNPHLSEEALAEIMEDLSEDDYKQEILAEFLENEGAVFRNIMACMNAHSTTPDEHKNHYKMMGVDWGRQTDSTAISLGCADCGMELAIDRFNKIDYHFQRQRLRAMAEKWNVTDILAESNAMGDPIITELQREGLPVRPFETTPSSKPPLIKHLALVFEREEFQFINNPVWTGELEAYEETISQKTGRSSFSAPEGMHDDTVMARALMCHGAVNDRWLIY